LGEIGLINNVIEINDTSHDESCRDAAVHIMEFDDERVALSYLYYKGR